MRSRASESITRINYQYALHETNDSDSSNLDLLWPTKILTCRPGSTFLELGHTQRKALIALSYDRTLLEVDCHIVQSHSDKRQVYEDLIYSQISVCNRMLVAD